MNNELTIVANLMNFINNFNKHGDGFESKLILKINANETGLKDIKIENEMSLWVIEKARIAPLMETLGSMACTEHYETVAGILSNGV